MLNCKVGSLMVFTSLQVSFRIYNVVVSTCEHVDEFLFEHLDWSLCNRRICTRRLWLLILSLKSLVLGKGVAASTGVLSHRAAEDTSQQFQHIGNRQDT